MTIRSSIGSEGRRHENYQSRHSKGEVVQLGDYQSQAQHCNSGSALRARWQFLFILLQGYAAQALLDQSNQPFFSRSHFSLNLFLPSSG